MPDSRYYRSPLTALLTMAGVAIGLGNVWRFPYMMGQNGGSAFLLLYLLMMLLFAVPALAAEWSLGRHARSGTLGAFSMALGRVPGLALGGLLVAGILIADSYYMVVVGNILFSTVFSTANGFDSGNLQAFSDLLGRGSVQYASSLVVLGFATWVLHRGLRHGIEAVSRLFVPVFGAIMLYLVAQTLMLEGALPRLGEFLAPDFSRIGPRELFAVLGQACFSLGIGGTFMVIYGHYLEDRARILPGALATGATDTAAALLAALFIMPAVLVFGLDPATGPRLVFQTLPELFAVMPLGRLAGTLFLGALSLMAFLSAVAGLVVCLGGLQYLLGQRFSRGRLLAGLVLAEAVLILPSALHPPLIGYLDLLFGSGMQIFGAAIAVMAAGWGLGAGALRRELGGGRVAAFLVPWLRWVIPAVFGGILIGYVLNTLR